MSDNEAAGLGSHEWAVAYAMETGRLTEAEAESLLFGAGGANARGLRRVVDQAKAQASRLRATVLANEELRARLAQARVKGG
jgi:hypothetical protein